MKFEDISNIHIEKSELDSYDKIELFKGEDRKDQFMLAMATGFLNKTKKTISSRHILFKTKYFKQDDDALLNSLALYETGKVETLADKAQIYRIAEEYANAGITILKNKENQSQIGNYLKKFEKEIIDNYRKLESLETNELDSYIISGEGAEIEFKSSMRWDVRENKVNKNLQKVIAKTIAGFLNFNGGTLLIGVADNGSIYGIEQDINSLNRKDLDGFEQFLIQLIENYLKAVFTHYINIDFLSKDNKTVCMVKVKPSDEPVYLTDKNTKEFYIRAGNTTRSLDVEDAMKYIKIHWDN